MNWLRYIIVFAGNCFIFAEPPENFQFNQSTLQGFYFFEIVTLNGTPLDNDDWVGAFNGNICVGARQWDTSQCGSGICDVTVMGYDNDDDTEGYCNIDDIPTFQIYDASEDYYYDAAASGMVDKNNGECEGEAPNCLEWHSNVYALIENLNEADCPDEYGCCTDLNHPDFTGPVDCNGVCGGSAFLDNCNDCVGGNTGLASGNSEDECGICDGPGADIECWDGSFSCANIDCPFNPDDCSDGTTFKGIFLNYENICVPYDFSSVQLSQNSAYYFFQSVEINGISIDPDDWIAAYNENVCVGARQWDTSQCGSGVCEVPIMGYESFNSTGTTGYMQEGEIPTFRIFDASENVYLDAIAFEDIPWANGLSPLIDNLIANTGCTDITACNYDENATIDNGTCTYATENLGCEELVIDVLSIPNTYKISNIYPNPFNPSTNIQYNIPENANVEVIIYNIHGRQIQILIDGFQTAGSHLVHWNASSFSSGTYFIRLNSGGITLTHKVVLVK